MKKLAYLTAITFSLLFSSNCWGEWTKVVNTEGELHPFYVDIGRIKRNGPYIYFWSLKNFEKPNYGYMSEAIYIQAECNVGRIQLLAHTLYSQTMGKGTPSEVSQETLELTDERLHKKWNRWKYPAPGTAYEIMMEKVCKFVKNK